MTALRIPRATGVAAWRRITDEIAADIEAGRFAPGAQLPSEAQLALRFAVNRHTVRHAISVLAEQGLVRATQGRGTFVETKPLAYPIGPRTRFSEIVTKAGHEAGGELIAAEQVSATEIIAHALRIASGAPVLRTETRRFIDTTPVTYAVSHFPLPRCDGFAAAYAQTGSVTRALKACGIHDYVRQETRISARSAQTDEAARLDLSPGRILLVVDSINVDLAGVPVQATRALFAADRVELEVKG
jgi:GntR family phosphonate transport system transcriptional regulator